MEKMFEKEKNVEMLFTIKCPVGYQHFLLFVQRFFKRHCPSSNIHYNIRLFTTQSQLLRTLRNKPFENIVGKEENAGNQHFLLFPTMFSTHPKTNFNFSVTFILSSASSFNLE